VTITKFGSTAVTQTSNTIAAQYKRLSSEVVPIVQY